MTDEVPSPTPAARDPLSWFGSGRGGALAVAISVVALGLAAAPYATGGGFGERVRAYLIANPGVLDEAVQARQAAEETNRVETINATVAANAALLAPDPRDPAFGPADAKVTVIQFFDYQCAACKGVSADYLALIRAYPDVRFVFKEWPILDRGGGTTSNLAARAALAAAAQDKYLTVHQDLMAEPNLDSSAIERIMSENGVNLDRAMTTIQSPEIERHIADIQSAATTLQLVGTPTFLINGRTTVTTSPVEVSAAIEAAKRS